MPSENLIVVLVKGYPRLSETFIAQELLGLERYGFRLFITSLRHPTDPISHPNSRHILAPVLYLPEYLYQGPLRVIRGVVYCARLPGFWKAVRLWLRDLRRDFSANRFRRFGQAAVLVSELPADTSWVYSHFIHTPSAVARYSSLISGLPWSCSAHAKDIWTSPDWELRENLATARWAVTCTEVGRQKLASLSSRPRNVRLVYHGLDLDQFGNNPKSNSDRNGSDPSDPVRLLSIGRAVEKKGLHTLIQALSLLPNRVCWRFTHIGAGPLLESLEAYSRELGLENRITWLGAQTQPAVIQAYRRADLVVLPCQKTKNGDQDGLPNVLLEALSQRVACLSTEVAGVPELIRDGETGLLVPPTSPGALSDAMLTLIQDSALRNRLASAGERFVRANFDMRTGLSSLAALFEVSLSEQRGLSDMGQSE